MATDQKASYDPLSHKLRPTKCEKNSISSKVGDSVLLSGVASDLVMLQSFYYDMTASVAGTRLVN